MNGGKGIYSSYRAESPVGFLAVVPPTGIANGKWNCEGRCMGAMM